LVPDAGKKIKHRRPDDFERNVEPLG